MAAGEGCEQRLARLDNVLRQVPYEYEQRDRLRNDVASLLRSTHTLQPDAQQFTGGGKSATMFYLGGVLPISYKGSTYNIPVTLYFDPPYPRLPPRCFVTPSAGMALKSPHPNVDAGGMTTVPYLQTWNQRNYQLTELVGALASAFSANPPVYSTQSSAAARGPAAVASAKASGQPPVPGATGLLDGLGQALGLSPQPQPARATPAGVVQPVPVRPVAIAQPSRREQLIAEVSRGLRERWTLALDPVADDVNAQVDRKADLQAAAAKVDGQIEGLRKAAVDAEKDAADLKCAEADLRAFLEQRGPSGPDTAGLREALDPDTQQVLNCLAEEHSLEELLVALDELLAAKLVSLDDFLREVRDVSRRQFMCKTQRQKAAALVVAAHPAAGGC